MTEIERAERTAQVPIGLLQRAMEWMRKPVITSKDIDQFEDDLEALAAAIKAAS